jgi:thiol:disulfide interchange protein
MTVPFLVTLALAIEDYRQDALSLSGKVGVTIAILSLSLAWKPLNAGIVRSRQSRNMPLKDLAAPPFDTLGIQGTKQSLEDQKGKVVLVNIWATWCEPCRTEMPVYPAIFLIDCRGRLQPAPSSGQAFQKIQAAVDALLKSGTD